MKQFIEFIPLIVFFLVYKFVDIFTATQALVLSSILTFGSLLLIKKKLEKMQWVSFIGVLLFGSFTLLFRNEAILKLKAPVVNWIFAIIFLLAPRLAKKNLVKIMLENTFELSEKQWKSLNYSWVLFFLITGCSNLFVAFYFHSIWVDFKVFGTLGLTFAFLIGQFLCLSSYVKEEAKKTNNQAR
ncbi:Probable intracellular septation protein A [Chlamydiales bacterium SCGC AB-751-O23]|jgi:intracellular septation protein|nr:Probable intracellular septation protein A [Chlamydiales bacterium SCGC AB-751-O23]